MAIVGTSIAARLWVAERLIDSRRVSRTSSARSRRAPARSAPLLLRRGEETIGATAERLRCHLGDPSEGVAGPPSGAMKAQCIGELIDHFSSASLDRCAYCVDHSPAGSDPHRESWFTV